MNAGQGYRGYYIPLPDRGWNVLKRSLPYSDGNNLSKTDYPVMSVLSRTVLVFKKDGGRILVARCEDVGQNEGHLLVAEYESLFKQGFYVITTIGNVIYGYDDKEGIFFERSLHSDGSFRYSNSMHGKSDFTRFTGRG